MYNGIKIFLESKRVSKHLSLANLMTLGASIIALLTVTIVITDCIMLNCFPKARRQAYKKAKVDKGPDFSDLQDRLYLVQQT